MGVIAGESTIYHAIQILRGTNFFKKLIPLPLICCQYLVMLIWSLQRIVEILIAALWHQRPRHLDEPIKDVEVLCGRRSSVKASLELAQRSLLPLFMHFFLFLKPKELLILHQNIIIASNFLYVDEAS